MRASGGANKDPATPSSEKETDSLRGDSRPAIHSCSEASSLPMKATARTSVAEASKWVYRPSKTVGLTKPRDQETTAPRPLNRPPHDEAAQATYW